MSGCSLLTKNQTYKESVKRGCRSSLNKVRAKVVKTRNSMAYHHSFLHDHILTSTSYHPQATRRLLFKARETPFRSNFVLRPDDARKSIISQILTPEAGDRLGRIAMVKESRARDLENRLIMMARTGRIRQRMTEDDLIELMKEIDKKKDEEQKIVFSRRKGVLDDDDDDDIDF